jgi:glycosyltransferase involved in cell wall biosynthesis
VFGAAPFLPALIDRLDCQTVGPQEILVIHTGAHDPTRLIAAAHPRLLIIHQEDRLFAGEARNRGLAEASGRWVAFLDSDVLPEPDWLENMHAALCQNPNCIVAGSVGVARAGGYWGLSLWAIEFSSVHPYLPDRAMAGGCSANLAAARETLLSVGGYPETVKTSEDVTLTARCRAAGLTNRFCSGAVVGHHNIPGLGHMVSHLASLGLWSAAARRREALPGSFVIRLWPLAGFLWIYRLALVYGRVLRWGKGYRAAFLIRLPAIVLAAFVWNCGFLYGIFVRVSDPNDISPSGYTRNRSSSV